MFWKQIKFSALHLHDMYFRSCMALVSDNVLSFHKIILWFFFFFYHYQKFYWICFLVIYLYIFKAKSNSLIIRFLNKISFSGVLWYCIIYFYFYFYFIFYLPWYLCISVFNTYIRTTYMYRYNLYLWICIQLPVKA